MEWWWIRHAPVAESGIYIGHKDVAAVLPPSAPPALPMAHWICSPLRRAYETAAWLGGAATRVPDIAEQCFGEWEGKAYEKSDAIWQDPVGIAAPGGESFAEVVARVGNYIDSMMAVPIIIAVAHAGAIRAALVHGLGYSPTEALQQPIDYLSLTRLRYKDGQTEVICINQPLSL